MAQHQRKKWWELDDEKVSEWQELKTPEGLSYYYNTRTGITQWDIPEELKTEEDYARAGAWVWKPDPEFAYVAAKVIEQGAKHWTLQTEDNVTHRVLAKNAKNFAKLQWNSLQRIVSDLTLLDAINAPLILHNLRRRFEQDKIYTNLGTILISVNPFQRLPLYGPSVIKDYQEKGLREMPPHVYNIADDALKGVLDHNENQSIIVSGESGAGKTEATKQCLSYLASNAGSKAQVEQKILLSNPILEAFGNAKTVRNDNSSRFGKYIEIFFNRDDEIVGSTTQNFLLEKVRVISFAPAERNFHVFYMLTKAADQETRDAFYLGYPQDYAYLNEAKSFDANGIDDIEEYNIMLKAMVELNFNNNDINNLFQTLSAILSLGNITFQDIGDRKCKISDANAAQTAAALLQISYENLEYCMTYRTLKIRGQKDTTVGLSAKEALEARNALAKFIYGNMFDWIVYKVNQAMTPPDINGRTIGILDIFGFEIFKHNSFEQLCINYTNEKLQQFFNANTFKLEEQIYASEGIQFKHVDFIDNQPVLDLIEYPKRPQGLLKLLDEQVVLPRGSDQAFITASGEMHKKNALFRPKPPNSFTIQHYAGLVNYDSRGFIDKNKDTLTEDALGALATSTFNFIGTIFPNLKKMSSLDRKRTLGFQFRRQLNDLMNKLYATEPHYIRCIKPNDVKKPNIFIAQNVFEQLTYSGVFEAVKIRKTGFPFRQLHLKFLDRYGIVFNKNYPRSKNGCQQLIQDLNLNKQNVRIGKTMVLYRAEEYKSMELQRSLVVQKYEVVEKLKKLLRTDANKLPDADRDKHFEKISKVVKKAKTFNIDDPIVQKARAVIAEYIESRIDPETKEMLIKARDARDQYLLRQAVDQADERGYETRLCKECKALLARIDRIVEESREAYRTYEEKHMAVCLAAADEIYFYSEEVETFRKLLHNTGKVELLKILLQKAVENKNEARAIRITIRVKTHIFESQQQLFNMDKCTLIKTREEWAGEKLLTLSRGELRTGMLVHTIDNIHSPLTWAASDNKELVKVAHQCFKNIQEFAGDRKCDNPQPAGINVIQQGLKYIALRDEIYTQLYKQIQSNPNPNSLAKVWQLLGGCIATFPPSQGFENFIEVFLKTRASSPDFVGAFHNVAYKGARFQCITPQELNNYVQVLQQRTEEYAEKLPSGPPSYADLEQPYHFDGDDVEFNRPTPKLDQHYARQDTSELRQSITKNSNWQEFIDNDTGEVYYWNKVTNESTWDCPPELKFALTTQVGIRA